MDCTLFVVFGLCTLLKYNLLYSDAEAEILQIGACCGSKSWMQYIMPTKSIDPSASAVNRITIANGQMFYDGQRVDAVPAQAALTEFCKFVERCGSIVILAAHNGKTFDFRR